MTAQLPITPGQRKQFRRFVEDAVGCAVSKVLARAQVGKIELQRVFPRGDELQMRVERAIETAITELAVGRFANEEVASNYGYFSGYKKPRTAADQLQRLHKLFLELRTADLQVADGKLPEDAEGWFLVPRWEKIAPTYGEAVQKVLDLIKKTRGGRFYNYREGRIGPQFLRQSEKSAAAWRKIGEEQKDHDVLVVPAQFGLLHRGRSVRRAREVMFDNQFGLGAFAIGIMLLTHPERLQHYDDLWIDCAGDEHSPGGDGVFSDAPIFIFYDGKVEFDANDCGHYDEYYGSASGFLAQ